MELLSRTARGYVGWLLTNEQFQKEQGALLSAREDDVRRSALSSVQRLTLSADDLSEPSFEAAKESGQRAFDDAMRAFLTRRRLRDGDHSATGGQQLLGHPEGPSDLDPSFPRTSSKWHE